MPAKLLNFLRQQANERKASNALSLARTTQLHYRGQKIRETLESLGKELAQRENGLDDLVASDKGKRIATNSELVLEFMAIEDDPCPLPSDVNSWQEQLEELVTVVDGAYAQKDGFFVATEQLATTISELHETVRKADRQFRDQRRKIVSILERAPKLQAGNDGPTLQQTIDAQLKAWDAEKSQAIKERMELARKENDQIIADAKAGAKKLTATQLAKVERRIGEAQARQIAEAAEDFATKERERIKKRADELARLQLERDYNRDLRQIQTYLQPFLGKGYRQPDLNGRYTVSSQPLAAADCSAICCR